MTVAKKLAGVHRRLKRPAQRNAKRKRAHNNSLSYDPLEVRRVLNAAPVGNNDLLYETAAGTTLTISTYQNGLLYNDYDLDIELGGSQTLTATNLPTSTVEGGTLAANSNGTFTYNPPSGFAGFDSFTYQVFDGSAYSPETQVSISVGQSLYAQLNDPEQGADSLLHSGALQTTQSLGGGLELVYRSDSTPNPVIAVETRFLAGATVPDSIVVETDFGGISSGITTYDVDVSFDPNEVIRFVQSVDAPNLATG